MTTIKIFDTSNPPPLFQKAWTKDEAISYAIQNPKDPRDRGVYRLNNLIWELPDRKTGEYTYSKGYVIFYTTTGNYEVKLSTKKVKVYLCLGGTFNGEQKSREDVEGEGYFGFNSDGYHPDPKNKRTFIWVHKDLL